MRDRAVPETDSNMAARALLWSFGGAVQDQNEQVVINSDAAVAAVEYMARLFKEAETPEVFSWTPKRPTTRRSSPASRPTS